MTFHDMSGGVPAPAALSAMPVTAAGPVARLAPYRRGDIRNDEIEP